MSGIDDRFNNLNTKVSSDYAKFKSSTGISYSGSSYDALYAQAQQTVQETQDSVNYTSSDSGSGVSKLAMGISIASAALPLATAAFALFKGSGSGSSKVAAGTNVDANLKAFQADASKSNRKTLEKDLTALRSQRDALQATVDSKNKEIGELKDRKTAEEKDGSETANVKAEIAKIDELLKGTDTTSAYGKALADSKAKQDEITGVDTQISTLEAQNADTVKARDKAAAEKTDAEAKSAELAGKISTAEADLTGLESDYSSKKDQLKEAKRKDGKYETVKQADGSYVKQKIDNKAEIKRLDGIANEAKEKVDAKKKEIKELKEGEDGKGGKKAQDDIVKAKTAEIEYYNKSMTDGKTNVKDLLEQKETLKAEKDALDKTAEDEKTKLTEKKQEYQTALDTGVAKDLQAKIETLEKEVKDITDGDLKTLNEKIATIETSLGIKGSSSTGASDETGTVTPTGDAGTGSTPATTDGADVKVGEDGLTDYIRESEDKPDVDNDASVQSMSMWEQQDIPGLPKNGDKKTVDGKEYTYQNNTWTDAEGYTYVDEWGRPGRRM